MKVGGRPGGISERPSWKRGYVKQALKDEKGFPGLERRGHEFWLRRMCERPHADMLAKELPSTNRCRSSLKSSPPTVQLAGPELGALPLLLGRRVLLHLVGAQLSFSCLGAVSRFKTAILLTQ